ncbi:MAG: phosphoadenosine phosphosulfate reductase [Bacteroidaceae bacterium]|nr:phosphoadenosine phosphosulfate reductase [Bacteroidaceae bacterium]
MSEVRHILGISGGKDSAALAIYMKKKYPQLKIIYYNSDTGCDLHETELLVNRLDTYLGGIIRLRAAEGSPEPTPFEHFLKASGNYLPSPQARWCTQKMKLAEMEKFIGDTPTISYVGIRGDEDREGYVSSKPNIQSIFPFRKNIWSVDVINKVLHNDNLAQLRELYNRLCPKAILPIALKIVDTPVSKEFFYGKKANALLDLDVKLFNHVVFEFLKTTDYPVGKLDEFPLIDNDDILVKADIFRILEDSGVGVPAYYYPVEFEVDGKKGTYSRSRSGCYFCFYQQKIEWIWLYEQHPDLYFKAMEFEKDGYTWNQNESLADLIKPERIRQIKLDAIKKQEAAKEKSKNLHLIDALGDDDEPFCANCFK